MKIILLIMIGVLIGGGLTYLYFLRSIPEIQKKAKDSLTKEEMKDRIWWIEAGESGSIAPGYNNGNGPLKSIPIDSGKNYFYGAGFEVGHSLPTGSFMVDKTTGRITEINGAYIGQLPMRPKTKDK
jgi:tetrahydromethanopterin S-methyltransferase subunit D